MLKPASSLLASSEFGNHAFRLEIPCDGRGDPLWLFASEWSPPVCGVLSGFSPSNGLLRFFVPVSASVPVLAFVALSIATAGELHVYPRALACLLYTVSGDSSVRKEIEDTHIGKYLLGGYLDDQSDRQ